MIQIVGPKLNQWDVGRSVSVTASEATHVHFANQGDSKAVIMEIVEGKAKIPDYLLRSGKTLLAYAVLDGVTLEAESFGVTKRERPENYVYEDDQRNYIYELIANAERAADNANAVAEELRTAKESGEFDGVSVTHKWNGTVLSVTSASGTSSADLKGERGPQGVRGEKGERGEQGPQGEQGLPGTDPVAISQAVDEALEENERLQLIPEGMSSNYYIKSGGWKRILVCIRSNAGIVNLALASNNSSCRTFQNVTFGYSMHVDHPTVKGTGKPFVSGDGPVLYQLVNNTFGEDPNQTELSRIFRIDKVRIAWPLSWDDTEEANTNNRYTNPVNTYLDIHVAGDVEAAYAINGIGVQLMTNILAKSYNHNTAAILEETDAPMSEDGYVLGLDDVKCQTKELVLRENSMFLIPGQSCFENLASKGFDQLVDDSVEVVAGSGTVPQRLSVSRIEFSFGGDDLVDGVQDIMGIGAPLIIRGSYAHNLLHAPRKPTNSNGITATKLHSGIYCLNGTATANGLAQLYNHEAGDQYPVRLLAGHTYYVSGGVQLRLGSSPDATDGFVYWNGYQGNSSAVLTRQYTSDTDLYILRASVFFYKGVTYDNYLYYPQVTEDASLVIKDLNVDAVGYPLREYKSYKTQTAANSTPALSYAAWLQKNVLPKEMYSPAPLVISLPDKGYYAAGLDLDLGEAWGCWDHQPLDDSDSSEQGEERLALPQLAGYRNILEKVDFLDAWQTFNTGVEPYTKVRVTGVFRRPVMAGGKLSADLNAGGKRITELSDPSTDTDAATKAYVDTAIAKLQQQIALLQAT